MSTIRVFNTHIEIYPYALGDNQALEKMLSYYDAVYHKTINIGFYIHDNTLYIPRGINLSMLNYLFGSIPSITYNGDKSDSLGKPYMKVEPRDNIQKEALDFLLSKGKFDKYKNRSQFGLNLDTGDGKTYTMINAIVSYNTKTIVIVHKSRLKTQWKDAFINMSSIEENDIIDLTGSSSINDVMNDRRKGLIYIITHQTIESYAKTYGWNAVREFFKKIKVGIKVFDEAHKFFHDILMIDYFSNTKKTFYITATFGRGNPKEVPIYKKAFTNMCRFGEETFNYEEKRKHINLIIIYYNSRPEAGTFVNTGYGFSNYKFIDYALKTDPHETLKRVLSRILDQTSHLKGKILITSPKIESVDYIADYINTLTDKSVGRVYSKNTKNENDNIISETDIISSTIKSIGEGDDIKGLRILINLDPVGSKILADQLRGRLREYSKEDDTFLFYPVDIGFNECTELFKRILPVMKKKCKKIIFVKWLDL